MSHFAKFCTVLKDANTLAAALRSMGYAVEQHASAQKLNGYTGFGDQNQFAEIIIRKHILAAVNQAAGKSHYFFGDAGFSRTVDGNYNATIDDLDMRSLNALVATSTVGSTWLNRVNQEYALEQRKSIALRNGYTPHPTRYREELRDGKVRLNFVVR